MFKVQSALLLMSLCCGLIVATPSPETPVNAETYVNSCNNELNVCVGVSDGSASYVNGTCNQYIVCAGGCANILTCPNNLQYNLKTGNCDYKNNVDCPWQSTPPSTGPSGVTCVQSGKCADQLDGKMFANPNSNGYLVCQCECEIERPCPDGTKFDEELAACALDTSEAPATTGSPITPETPASPETPETTTPATTTTPETPTTPVTPETPTVCAEDNNICNGVPDDTLRPVDGVCNKFYICINGCAIENVCPNN